MKYDEAMKNDQQSSAINLSSNLFTNFEVNTSESD